MLKGILISAIFFSISFLSAKAALAHVVIKPSEVGIGKFQTFTVGVPVEREIATVGLRLFLPEGLNHVSPNIKTGWTIELKKTGDDHEAAVREIIWSGGTIPQGFRDEFIFSAQVPTKETTIAWKAYQTYADGTVVAWDLDPQKSKDQEDFSKSGPYSETKIVNDLAIQQAEAEEKSTIENYKLLTGAALIFSLLALVLQFRKKRV